VVFVSEQRLMKGEEGYGASKMQKKTQQMASMWDGL